MMEDPETVMRVSEGNIVESGEDISDEDNEEDYDSKEDQIIDQRSQIEKLTN